MLMVLYMAWMISLTDAPARPHGDAQSTAAARTLTLAAPKPAERYKRLPDFTRRAFTGLAR